MDVTFTRIDADEKINLWRSRYFDSLSECQEQYLEFLIRDALFYEITIDASPAGYCAVDFSKQLLEYFLLPELVHHSEKILKDLLDEFGIVRSYIKSFDSLPVSTFLTLGAAVKVVGVNFRGNHLPTELPKRDDITVRTADESHFQIVSNLREELFESDEEIREFIEKRQITLFDIDGDMVGVGIVSQIIPDKPHYDIGMGVSSAHRKEGIGTYIIKYLRMLCYTKGWIPVCGCDSGNIGSRRTLEKAGFVPLYRMLEFTF